MLNAKTKDEAEPFDDNGGAAKSIWFSHLAFGILPFF
jgi:hypothetical protein